MPKINNVSLESSNLSSTKSFLTYNVTGEPGSVFSIYLRRTNQGSPIFSYYDFTNNTQDFTNDFSRKAELTIPNSGNFRGNISLPTVIEDITYKLFVQAEAHYDTFFDSSFSENKYLYETNDISVLTQRTFTFSLRSKDFTLDLSTAPNFTQVVDPFKSNSAYLADLPSDTSVTMYPFETNVSSTQTGTIKQTLSLNKGSFTKVENVDYSEDLFDFDVPRVQTASASTNSTEVSVKNNTSLFSVTDLEVGMELVHATGSTLNPIKGTTITDIVFVRDDIYTLTLSSANSFEVNKQLTFTKNGNIGAADIGNCIFSISNFSLTLSDMTTTTDSAVSNSKTIPVVSTDGIAVGTGITMSGIGVTSDNPSVTAVSKNDFVEVSSNQTIENGQTVVFTGSSNTATISFDFEITQLNDSNVQTTSGIDILGDVKTYLDLDKILKINT